MERDKVSQPWTNEKHSLYLDEMEVSFVRTMLEGPGARMPRRQDRYVSDSCDSTQDTKSRVRNEYPWPCSSSSGTSKVDDNVVNRRRRPATESGNDSSALDQVVPQI